MHRHAYLGTLLCLVSCLDARDHALFDQRSDLATGGSAPVAAAFGAQAGTDSGSGGGQAATGSGAAAGSASESGGSGGSLAEPVAGASTAGAAPNDDVIPRIEDCSMVEGAVTSELSPHCYRVDTTELTFAEARTACHRAGGHLVTISSQQENDFIEELHDGEHWIGATDGRPDTMPGAGPYTWVVEEAFDYSDWEDGQPNAYETNCPEQGDESDCFEHCAFQTDDGDWNDRSCWHTIASICEWDIAAADGAAGSAP